MVSVDSFKVPETHNSQAASRHRRSASQLTTLRCYCFDEPIISTMIRITNMIVITSRAIFQKL